MKFDRRLLELARSSQALLVMIISLGLAGGILVALQARLMSAIIGRAYLDGQGLPELSTGMGWLLVILLLRAGLVWGQEAAGGAAAVGIKTRLRSELFERILLLGPAYTRGERTGELANLAVEGVEALHAYFSQYLPQLALAALVPLTFLAIILPLDLLSGVVLLLTAPLMPVFMILIGSLAAVLTNRQWETLSRLSAYFLDALQGLATLKVFGRAQAQVHLIARISEEYRQTTMGVLRVTFLSALALELLATLSTAIVAVEVGLRVLYGRLEFEQAFFILLLAPEFYLPLRLLGARFHAGMAGVAAAERIFDVMENNPPPLPLPRGRGGENNHHRDFVGAQRPQNLYDVEEFKVKGLFRLGFEGVSFSYPDGVEALKNITFEIEAGQRIAVVGQSGAGKSTLAALLLRFIQPSQGRITLDGEDIADYPIEDWRQAIAWVPQKPYLFNDSLFANIRLARPGASLLEVEQAAHLAHADGFIQALPDGYETRIGEHGARLSAGQAQRIALARAFLKDAPILILDEPTSSLDPEHERWVADSLEKLAAGKLVLVIAHRMATARRAERILVLDRGQLVQQGSHAELLARDGLYNQLVRGTIPKPPPPPPERNLRNWDMASAERPPYPSFTISGRGGNVAYLLRLVAPLGGWIGLAGLLGAATVGSSIGLMSAAAYIIAAAALHPSIAVLQVAIVGVRFFGLSRGVFRYLERIVSHHVTFKVLARLRVWFYQALEPLAPARLLEYRSGDLLGRAISDVTELESFYVRALAPPLVALIVAVFTLLYLSSYDPALALTLLLFYLAGGLGVTLLARWLGRSPGEAIVQERAALNATLVDGVQGLADLLAFNQTGHQKTLVDGLSHRFGAAQGRMARLGGLQSALSGLVANLAMWAILAQAITMVRDGRLEGVYLAVLPLAALTSFEALLPLPLAAQSMQSHLAAARRLFQLVDAQPEVRDPAQPAAAPTRFDLEVRDLRFVYPSAGPNQPALDGLTFSLPQGGQLALVGPSGAGKTSLVNLLLRFWEYREGTILLGGRDLRSYRQDQVRRSISLVSQNTDLFTTTVKENLLIARPDASLDEIIQAARLAGIHDFIQSLPHGYDTWIGEQGIRLSGGERQRLAIARALLKDAPLLIMDEPTANLDTLTEHSLLEGLQPVLEGRTTLWITHRLVGLENVDEILVLEHGRVVQQGRHADLIVSEGLYRRMWQLQNQGIIDNGLF